MKKDQLRSALINKGISRSYYSLEGGLPNEKLCLDYENGKWVVYYSERGVRTGIQYFNNEDDACDYLLHAIEESASGKYWRVVIICRAPSDHLRTKVHGMWLPRDPCMAVGIAKNNTNLGNSGATQYFIENKDKLNIVDKGRIIAYGN